MKKSRVTIFLQTIIYVVLFFFFRELSTYFYIPKLLYNLILKCFYVILMFYEFKLIININQNLIT